MDIIQKDIKLEIGQEYKIFDISDFMACTTTRLIKICGFDQERYIFSEKGKRKKYYLNIKEDTIIIPGNHAEDLKADSETSSFCGNALLNLLGTEQEIKQKIEAYNLNPFLKKGCICAVDRINHKEVMVYLEDAKQLHHGVIERIIAKQGA